jgi:hypothetical protein
VTFDAAAILNKDHAFGTMTAEDFLTGELHVEIPMKLGIESAVYKDVTEIMLDPDLIERLKEVQSGELHIEIENHLPTGFIFDVQFNDEAMNPVFKPQNSAGGPFHVAGGVLDGDGAVAASTVSTFVVKLNAEEIAAFIKSRYMAYVITLDPTTAPPIQFRMDDFITMKTFATFSTNSVVVTDK